MTREFQNILGQVREHEEYARVHFERGEIDDAQKQLTKATSLLNALCGAIGRPYTPVSASHLIAVSTNV